MLPVGESATLDLSPYFRDPDGDALTYAAAASSAAVSVTVTGETVRVTALARGVVTVTVTATDGAGLIAQQRFLVTVPNRAPEAAEIPPQTVFAGETATVDAADYFSDPDGDALTYAVESSRPEVAAVALMGSAVAVRALIPGGASVTVTARDVDGETAERVFAVDVPNRAPEVVASIPPLEVATGETAAVDAQLHFSDPDGEALTYAVESSRAAVAVEVDSAGVVTVEGVTAGDAVVTITASDPGGLSAAAAFDVTSGDPFGIELRFITDVTPTQREAFKRAADRWMAILRPTELPDIPIDDALHCGEAGFTQRVGTVDDLVIVAAIEEIDGPLGILGQAAPCWIRRGNLLPFYGLMLFDIADIDIIEQRGALEPVILHEMAHVLGVGSLWGYKGLLEDPASETSTPDTHFTGPLAAAAFDDVGGTTYEGAAVPVENTGGPGTRNVHWRETVFGSELLTGWFDESDHRPLSVVTVQSLADLGYVVDPAPADSYRLPTAAAAHAHDPAGRIFLGNDIWQGPIIIADQEGRIVRVIQAAARSDPPRE